MVVNGIPVKIESGGRKTGGSLIIDGTDFSHWTESLHLDMGAGTMPRLSVKLAGVMLDAEVVAEVVIPDEIQELLLKLGWTAPVREGGEPR